MITTHSFHDYLAHLRTSALIFSLIIDCFILDPGEYIKLFLLAA